MSKRKTQKDNFVENCEWLFNKPIYHRGKFNNANIYENTMESYKAAMDINGAIELDVQLTNDN